MQKHHAFWEAVSYIALFGCVAGQIIVGYWYLFAQGVYLFCNTAMTIRSFAIQQTTADKVKNIVFTAITLGLIVIRLVQMWG